MKTIQEVYLHNVSTPQEVKLTPGFKVLSICYKNSNGYTIHYEKDDTNPEVVVTFCILRLLDKVPGGAEHIISYSDSNKQIHLYKLK